MVQQTFTSLFYSSHKWNIGLHSIVRDFVGISLNYGPQEITGDGSLKSCEATNPDSSDEECVPEAKLEFLLCVEVLSLAGKQLVFQQPLRSSRVSSKGSLEYRDVKAK